MPPTAARPPKVQRWIDVIAALLLYHYPITFEQLAEGVPAYADPEQKADARMRIFERDNDKLRELGVPIDEGGRRERGDESRSFETAPFLDLSKASQEHRHHRSEMNSRC
ncbi:MAG: hypothetical protein NTU67_10180 [Gemmatimonadetes bacterium]|nr:hypothetical protein [Gemmatimonadota bacterium]